jgi:type VI secretion system secreted protein VgrG
MNKLIALLTGILLFPVFFMAGCNDIKNSPSFPESGMDGNGNTGNPTATMTPSGIATPQVAQTPINLVSASSFAVLASSQVTNIGSTTLCGDIGVSPGTSIGVGYLLECNGVTHINDGEAVSAEGDLKVAYNDAAGRRTPAVVAGDLGGQTLYPGLYQSTGSIEIASGNLILDAQGNPDGVFIFQVLSTLTCTSDRQVILAGDANSSNVFWQVGGSCLLDTNTSFSGTILADGLITLNPGAVLAGRVLSQAGGVALSSNNITVPSP